MLENIRGTAVDKSSSRNSNQVIHRPALHRHGPDALQHGHPGSRRDSSTIHNGGEAHHFRGNSFRDNALLSKPKVADAGGNKGGTSISTNDQDPNDNGRFLGIY